jgi:hypothetical protein
MVLQGVRTTYSLEAGGASETARRCQLVLIGRGLNAQQVARSYEQATQRRVRWLAPVRGEQPSALTAAFRLVSLAGLVALLLAPEAASSYLDALYPGSAAVLFQWRWLLLTLAALLFGAKHLLDAINNKDDD